ncbi:universal stress protein [Pseudomonas typographi]|uniref:Universal stress protein n=1 Tax=Pseudomonas typographi TaxID=2715964 RepID=A0ABR7Z6Q9_9PSED|nr:universal stress protein [Pseudomonas typographi]MBD1588509.1 universal stress protein [Pseudomonas typographi]MBD1601211.1 universal stress protein [Pseudomonas typographi]
MIRSMLYATDLGIYAPYVLQHALALARAFKAELHVVHAVEPIGRFGESVLRSYLNDAALHTLQQQKISDVLVAIEQRVLQELHDDLADSGHDLALIQAVRVVQGDAAEVILDQARRLDVDLLVMGNRCAGSNQAPALGRTASRVLQLASAPVYLVPRPAMAVAH